MKSSDKDEKGRFITGNNGGGRPMGARNKLSEQFIHDIYASWQAHGKAAIREMIETKPSEYVKVVASLLPKELNIDHSGLEDLTDKQLVQRLKALTAQALPLLAEIEDEADDETAPVHH